MSFPFLIDVLFKSLAVVCACALGWHAARDSSAASRNLVLRIGIVMLLALPALVLVVPTWEIPVVAAAPTIEPRPAHAGMPIHWLMALYVFGVGFSALRTAFAAGIAFSIVRKGLEVERRGRYRVVLSDGATSPFAIGLIHPSIVLPTAALKWDSELRESVIEHEVAHLDRGDYRWLLLTRIASAVYWLNPGMSWMARQIRHDAEIAADDLVVRQGRERVEYAEHLIWVARNCRASMALAPMAVEPPLAGRLRALFTEGGRGLPSTSAVQAGLACGLLCAVPIAALGASSPGSMRVSYQFETKPAIAVVGGNSDLLIEGAPLPPAEVEVQDIKLPAERIDEAPVAVPAEDVRVRVMAHPPVIAPMDSATTYAPSADSTRFKTQVFVLSR